MRRFFVSLYLGIIASIVVFFIVGHVLTTSVLTDVESLIVADNFKAEIELLEKLEPQLTAEEFEQHLLRIADLNQRIIEQVTLSEVPAEIQALMKSSSFAFNENHGDYFRAFQPQRTYLVIENENHPLYVMEDKTNLLVLLCLFLIVAVSCFIWILSLQRKLKPIENTLELISEGDLNARTPKRNNLQVGNINLRVNQLAERIAQLLNSHKKLTHTIAHEFRSPLFRIQMQLELLQEHKDDQQKYVTGIEEDLQDLQDLIDELLQYAQLDQAYYRLKKQHVDPVILIKEVQQRLMANSDKSIMLEAAGIEKCRMLVDKKLMQRCAANLIGNAIKYCNHEVIVKMVIAKDKLKICIDDDGEGIPKEEWGTVFEPFFRSQSQQKQGYGLGLAISKEIVELHNGTIELEQSELGGARFIVSLPTV